MQDGRVTSESRILKETKGFKEVTSREQKQVSDLPIENKPPSEIFSQNKAEFLSSDKSVSHLKKSLDKEKLNILRQSKGTFGSGTLIEQEATGHPDKS